MGTGIGKCRKIADHVPSSHRKEREKEAHRERQKENEQERRENEQERRERGYKSSKPTPQ